MDTGILKGKKVLIVDDDLDIIEFMEEALDMCELHTADQYETAKQMLEDNDYDMAVLDIMGVNGYELLSLANKRGIPAVMLTAHALSADNFAKSMSGGRLRLSSQGQALRDRRISVRRDRGWLPPGGGAWQVVRPPQRLL